MRCQGANQVVCWFFALRKFPCSRQREREREWGRGLWLLQAALALANYNYRTHRQTQTNIFSKIREDYDSHEDRQLTQIRVGMGATKWEQRAVMIVEHAFDCNGSPMVAIVGARADLLTQAQNIRLGAPNQ